MTPEPFDRDATRVAFTSIGNSMSNEQQSADPTEAEAVTQQLAKLLLEMGPLGVFFLTNSYYGIFWGTGAFMIATVVSLTASRILFSRIPLMPLISGVFVLAFGGLTLYLHNEIFIKMKPTIVNSLFATILFGGLYFGQSLLRYVFGEVFRLTDAGWRILTYRWAIFFVILAILNEVIWRNYSTDVWVSFKVFGIMPLSMAFAIAQIGVLKKYEDPAPR